MPARLTQAVAIPATLTLTLLLAGCGVIARQVAKEGSPGGVEGGLASIDDPAKQQQVGDILDGPVGEGFGRAFTRGMTAEGIALVTGTTQPSPRPTTGPAVTQQTGLYGPTPTAQPAPSVRTVIRDAALGLNDAVTEARDDTGVLAGSRDLLATALRLALAAVAALGLLALALALWVWLVLAKARKARNEARLHEAGTARLLEALRAADGRPWAPELAALLRAKLDEPVEEPRSSARRGKVRDKREDVDDNWEAEGRDDAAKRGAAHPGRGERVERT